MQATDQLPLAEPPPPALAAPVECRDCHRPLTDPTSRTYRRGRDCRAKHGLHPGRRTDGHHVDQDHIPGT